VKRILLVGVSTRAAAESAAAAGFAVTTLDAFGDRDVSPSVRALSLPRDFGTPFTPAAAARAARSVECDAVAYLSSFENHPRAVTALAAGRTLWGNAPAALRRVRDPMLVARALGQRHIAVPDVTLSATRADVSRGWLVKPLASGGGHGIEPWTGGAVPRGCYLQEHIEGTPGSVVFVAAGGRAVMLGVSRQLIGEPAFGLDGYRYCGSILAGAGDASFAGDEGLVAAASAIAAALAEAFDLVGVNGVDFVARDGYPYAVEINPRWCGSMELVERAYGVSVFGAHASACADGGLPAFDLTHARRGAGAFGKAVIFAREDVTIGETAAWLADSSVADVPHPGERIAARRPVCTVFAAAPDGAACQAELIQRAERIYAELAACYDSRSSEGLP
jgi:predicted ATP-grasp superfamily ATP-dependent carboligase